MFTKIKTVTVLGLLAVFIISSCKKDNNIDIEVVKPTYVIDNTVGIYLLNEGSWGLANGTLSYYDIATKKVTDDIFKTANNRTLGETPNDLKAYGSKMYVVISGTQGKKQSFVEILDIATAKSLKTISFNNEAGVSASMPRFITFHKGKAYVSSYDGKISRIDTATLAVDDVLQLKNGANNADGLEDLTVANNKLYVTNSSHPDFKKGLISKVTVVDLLSFKKIKDIEVGNNPTRIASSTDGSVYVINWFDYPNSLDNGKLVKINSNKDEVELSFAYNEGKDLGNISVYNNKGYVSQGADIKLFDLSTLKLTNGFITDGTATGYNNGLTVNPFDDSLVSTDYSGNVFVFNNLGKLTHKFQTPTGPKVAVFKYSYKRK